MKRGQRRFDEYFRCITGNKGNVHLSIVNKHFESDSYEEIADDHRQIKTAYKNHSTNICCSIMQGIKTPMHNFYRRQL